MEEIPMKRLALVLAAALLQTGCLWDGDECDRTATVDWTGFVLAEGGAPVGCAAAGVSDVDIWVNNGFWGTFACGGPPATVSLARGTNFVTVEGIAAGQIAYRHTVSVDATSCGDRGIVATQPGEGFFEVDYAFAPANACFAPGPTYMWLMVFDDVAGQTAFVETATTPFQECTVTAAAPRYRLPEGSFTLFGIEEVSVSLGTVGADCTDRPFDMGAGAVTTVQPILVDSSQQCF
jgi:hypothetical protein